MPQIGPHGEILSDIQEESVLTTLRERGVKAALEQVAGDIAYGIIEIGGMHRTIEYEFKFQNGVLCDGTGQDVRNLVQPSQELIQKIGPENIPQLSDKYVRDFLSIKEAFEKGRANEVFHTSDEGGDQLVVYRYYRVGDTVKCSASFFHKDSPQLGTFARALSKISGANFHGLARENSSPVFLSEKTISHSMIEKAGQAAGLNFQRDLSPMRIKELIKEQGEALLANCHSYQDVARVLGDMSRLNNSLLGCSFDSKYSNKTLNEQYKALYLHLVENGSSLSQGMLAGQTSAPELTAYELPFGITVRSFPSSLQLPFNGQGDMQTSSASAPGSGVSGSGSLPAGLGNMPALPLAILQSQGLTGFHGLSAPTSTIGQALFASNAENVAGDFSGTLRRLTPAPKKIAAKKIVKSRSEKEEDAGQATERTPRMAFLQGKVAGGRVLPDQFGGRSRVHGMKARESGIDPSPSVHGSRVIPRAQSDRKRQSELQSSDKALTSESTQKEDVRVQHLSEILESRRISQPELRDTPAFGPEVKEGQQGRVSPDEVEEQILARELDLLEPDNALQEFSEQQPHAESLEYEESELLAEQALKAEEFEELELTHGQSVDIVLQEFEKEPDEDFAEQPDFDTGDGPALEEVNQYEETALHVDVLLDEEMSASEDIEQREIAQDTDPEELIVARMAEGDFLDAPIEGTELDFESERTLNQEQPQIEEGVELEAAYEAEYEAEESLLDTAVLLTEEELRDYLISGVEGEVLTQLQDSVSFQDRLQALRILRDVSLERELELLEFMLQQQRKRKKKIDLSYFLFRIMLDLELEPELEDELFALLRFNRDELRRFARLARELAEDPRIELALAMNEGEH